MRRFGSFIVIAGFGALLACGIGASAARAATRIVTPAAGSTISLDPAGKPQQITITATGFQPNDQVNVVQCDGVAATDPKWQATLDCDTATSPAAASADTHGKVTFPANDVNFGLQPFIGPSPQRLFNCLAPGQAQPKNGLRSYTNCQLRVSTNLLHPASDQAFVTFQFARQGQSSSSSSNTGLIVIIVVVAVLVIVGVIVFLRRRDHVAARG